MTAGDESTLRVLDELGRVVRQLTRISGGPGEGPAMTATQRLALFEVVEEGPLRLSDLAARVGTSAPTATPPGDAPVEGRPRRRPAARWTRSSRPVSPSAARTTPTAARSRSS